MYKTVCTISALSIYYRQVLEAITILRVLNNIAIEINFLCRFPLQHGRISPGCTINILQLNRKSSRRSYADVISQENNAIVLAGGWSLVIMNHHTVKALWEAAAYCIH